MSTSSATVDARARKNVSIALQRIALTGQAKIADEIGLSASTVSRYCSDEEGLARACKLLAAAGVKLVPIEFKCFPRETVAAYMHLAKQHLATLESVDDLEVQ